MNRRLRNGYIMVLAITLIIGCPSATGKQTDISYPAQLIGVWQGDSKTCRLPGDMDSDTRIEIKANKLIDYEQWNEPLVVLQISRKPQAWKVKSRLHIEEHSVDQHEIYILSGSDKATLTVVDQSRSAHYARCK